MRVGESRLKAFQQNTGARAVIGYRRDVNYDAGELFQNRLLEALSRYRQTGAPTRHQRENYGYLCNKLGFEYICCIRSRRFRSPTGQRHQVNGGSISKRPSSNDPASVRTNTPMESSYSSMPADWSQPRRKFNWAARR